MGFKTQILRAPRTLFGMVMDNATHEGMETIRWLASRARRPRAPRNSHGDDVALKPAFTAQCRKYGYEATAFMRGRELTGSIVTQINITPKYGLAVKIIETAITDPKPDSDKRLVLQVKLQETLSESLIQQMVGQPLAKLIEIDGPINDVLRAYTIKKIYSSRGTEGFSMIDAILSGDSK